MRANSSSVVLWASAFVIVALIIMQAGRLPQNAAFAEMSDSKGDYTLATVNSGRGLDIDRDEVLIVIDNRSEVILVYEIENAQRERILLRDGGSLDNLFRQATR